jgi:hypothetical protein
MLDADRWIEDRLRLVLREEANAVPFTLTVADLERRRLERARPSILPRRQLPLWAAAIGLVLLGIAGILVLSRGLDGMVPPAPTPAPSLVPSLPPELPSSATLLEGTPAATLRLEGRRDPADPVASPAPDDRYLVGQVTMSSMWRLGAACTGPDRVVVEVGSLERVGTYVRSDIQCDGRTHVVPSSDAPLPGEVLDVAVLASPEAAWAVAVGEFDEALSQPPDLGPLPETPGWFRLGAGPPTLVTADGPSGARSPTPPMATTAAAWITCTGDAPLTVVFGSTTKTLDCAADPTDHLVTPTDGLDELSLELRTTGLVWAAWAIETDSIAIVYPSAPALPPDVAGATWAAGGTAYLTTGTVGSPDQALIPLGPHQAAEARGDLVVVARAGEGRGLVELVSIPAGRIVRTLVRATAFIPQAWLDARQEQAIYVLHDEVRTEFRAVGLDGTDDRRLLRIEALVDGDDRVSVAAALSQDDRIFVAEHCRASGRCLRSFVDLETGAVRDVETSSQPMCSIIAVTDGLVIGRSAPGCAGDGAPVTAVAALDGGTALVLEAAAGQGGVLVPTDDGPRLVVALEPESDGRQTVVAIDVENGDAETIFEMGASPGFLTPVPVRLPDGYVLLATSLSDDPAQRGFFTRLVPVLVDLGTGTRTELPNLPHSLEPTPTDP